MFTDCEIQAKEIFASPIILVYSAAQYWLHAILKWVRSGRRVIEGLTFLMHRRFCNDVLPKSTLEDPGDLIQASQTSHQLYQAHIWWNHPRSCKIIQDHPRLQGILGDITRKMLVLRFQLPPLPPQFQLGCLGAVGDMTRNGVGSLHKTVPKDMQQRTLVCGDLLKKKNSPSWPWVKTWASGFCFMVSIHEILQSVFDLRHHISKRIYLL